MIYHRILITTLALIFSTTTFAESCPTISDIKHNLLRTWTAYDSETKIALSPLELAKFKKATEQFALAEWSDKENGGIRCYYHTSKGSQIRAYLARTSLALEKTNKHWYAVSGHMHCAAGNDQCSFQINADNSLKATKNMV